MAAEVGSGGSEGGFVVRALLGAAVLITAARPFAFPSTGLDPGWKAALVMARVRGISYGNGFDFTYGPWGWLTTGTVIERRYMAISIVFVVFVAISIVVVTWFLLRRSFSDLSAASIVLVVVVPLASRVAIDLLLLVAILGLALLLIEGYTGDRTPPLWIVASAATVAGLMLMVKFSTGIFAFVVLALMSMNWWRSIRTVATIFIGYLAAVFAWWFLSELSFHGFVNWLSDSLSIATGYAGGQGLSAHQPLNILLYGMFCAATIVLFFRRVRAERWSRTTRTTAAALVVFVAYAGLKLGFVREGPANISFAYCLFVPLWIWLSRPVGQLARRLLVVGLPVALAITFLAVEEPSAANLGLLFDWPARAGVWIHNGDLLTSNVTFARESAAARSANRSVYGFSDTLLGVLDTSSVQVDPWDATAAWTYDLGWSPTPVFQTYLLFTNHLDSVNTASLAERSRSEGILINTFDVGNIDDRLSLWTSPSYQLGLTCDWELGTKDGSWELWVKSSRDRCGEPVTISTTVVKGGEDVPIPVSQDRSITVARFRPASSPAAALLALLFKPLDRIFIDFAGRHIQQPWGLSGAPMLVSCPANAAGSDRYAPVCPDHGSMSFSVPGEVTFERIPFAP